MNRKIPFVNLLSQYKSIKNELDDVIRDVIENSWFIRGPYVEMFEKKYAELMERNFCLSCANGTDSLFIAMKALGVRPGDEVIAPSQSWISTTETITQAGGKVVFCDVDPETFTIDPAKIKEKITDKTVGIIPVHLYGHPADMDAIMCIAEEYGLWILEDCAQAHLAKINGRLVGTFGDIASFSFYPGKNLGAMGDAGALITNSQEFDNNMRMFARHGGIEKHDHTIEGINSRMDGLQAAILSVKLKYLNLWTEKRREIANKYQILLKNITQIELPITKPNMMHAWHLFVIKCKYRDELSDYLRSRGVETSINYPVALPYLPAYSYMRNQPNDFPVAFDNQHKILSLPIYPELSDDGINFITNEIKLFYKNK